MPEPVTQAAPPAELRGVAVGFCGKLPARGDFVGSGLPRRFVEPWHDWLQRMLFASRQCLGAEWLPAWLGAPVWRFALGPGLCGPAAVLGLWMPSVDRVGRHFPLTLAAVTQAAEPDALLDAGSGFLDAAETAGRDALDCDLAPEELASRLAAAWQAAADRCLPDALRCPPGGALWWSDGSDRVPPSRFAGAALPDAAAFAAMLDARAGTPAP